MAEKKTPYEELVSKLQNSRKKLDGEMSKEMTKAYKQAFVSSYEELNAMIEASYNKGGEATEDLIKAKVEYTRQIHNQIDKIISKYEDLETEEYADAYMDFFDTVLPYYKDIDKEGFMTTVRNRVDLTNKRILQIMDKGGIYKDNAGLSDRLWGAAEFSGNKLHDAIMSCIAQGKGPADIAKTIQQFGTGGHKIWDYTKLKEKLGPNYANKYSGGLDYAALRLARTTMTHLHQLQVIKSNEFNPYVGKIRYHSVHADGRTCNMCNERDGQIFSRTKCPLDHPNGMCWLEPVFTDNKGNIMTSEQIGEDLGKWIRGEDNTGLMDKIPEYKDLPVVNTNNKKKKATTSKTTKTTKKANTIPDEQFDNYYAHFSDKVTKASDADYMRKVADTLKDKYPKFAQEGYLKIYDNIQQLTQLNSGAYWNHSKKQVQFNIERVLQQAKRTGRGMYDVWFHETGHAMDSLLAERLADLQHKWKFKPLSSKQSFINALYTDLENQRLMVKKKYLQSIGENLADYTDDMIHKTLPDSELQNIYYSLLANNNKTAGIQDVLEGLTNCKIQVRWGHGKEYWNRNNRNEEVASEAWANILGSYSDEETNELMKEYFPNAMKEQEKIIKSTLKSIQAKEAKK